MTAGTPVDYTAGHTYIYETVDTLHILRRDEDIPYCLDWWQTIDAFWRRGYLFEYFFYLFILALRSRRVHVRVNIRSSATDRKIMTNLRNIFQLSLYKIYQPYRVPLKTCYWFVLEGPASRAPLCIHRYQSVCCCCAGVCLLVMMRSKLDTAALCC